MHLISMKHISSSGHLWNEGFFFPNILRFSYEDEPITVKLLHDSCEIRVSQVFLTLVLKLLLLIPPNTWPLLWATTPLLCPLTLRSEPDERLSASPCMISLTVCLVNGHPFRSGAKIS